jgi:hypothetical protein
LLPGHDIGRVLLVPSNAVIKLCGLRIRQGCRVRFQAFPYRIEQFSLLGRGEAIYLCSQIAHTPPSGAEIPVRLLNSSATPLNHQARRLAGAWIAATRSSRNTAARAPSATR